MNLLKKIEIQGQRAPLNSLGRWKTVPNCIRARNKGKGVMDISVDAPNCHQRAHVGSLLLNGFVLIPTSRDNGNRWLQSFLVPNHPCNSVINLSPNKDLVSLYDMTNCTQARNKGNGVMDILMDAPNCHYQTAHAGSLLLNGFVLLPTSRDNGNRWLQSFLVPNHPCNSAINLSPNKDLVSLYNMTNGIAATSAMVGPQTPASMEINECSNLEYIPREIIDSNSVIPNNPKVIAEERVAKTPRKMIIETAENSRVKRTYLRKKKEVNPQPNPRFALGEKNVADQNNFCRNPSVKRSLNFDLNDGRQTKKLNTQDNAASILKLDEKCVEERLSESSIAKKLTPKRNFNISKNSMTSNFKQPTDLQIHLEHIPKFLHPFVLSIEDVIGDGACGFRCIAEQIDVLNGDWVEVKKIMLQDLHNHWELYARWLGVEMCKNMSSILEMHCTSPSSQYWMSMPEMGYVIANAFYSVVVFISHIQSLTFVPHQNGPEKGKEPRIISFVHANGDHFMKVKFISTAPMPPIASLWSQFTTTEAREWGTLFVDRHREFDRLKPSSMATIDAFVDLNSS